MAFCLGVKFFEFLLQFFDPGAKLNPQAKIQLPSFEFFFRCHPSFHLSDVFDSVLAVTTENATADKTSQGFIFIRKTREITCN